MADKGGPPPGELCVGLKTPDRKNDVMKYHENVQILKWTLERQDGMIRTGLFYLWIGSSGGLLWTRYWTSEFNKILRNLSVAAQLAASQEGLNSMELVF
jgi:hypothetical protein